MTGQGAICILHGYLLEGSGSNLWTRAIVDALVRAGETIHLMAQEDHPERYPFIREAINYAQDGSVERWVNPHSPEGGGCILHRPELGDTLPVYVWDRYESYPRVVPMSDLSDGEIESYIRRNVDVLLRVIEEYGITALHANHAVLMSVVAHRAAAYAGIPYSIMPHGSALEYGVKKDARLLRLATPAFEHASRVFVIGDEMRERVRAVFQDVALEERFSGLHLGVDTAQFRVVDRAARRASAAALGEFVRGRSGGRTQAQTHAFREMLRGDMDEVALQSAVERAQAYDGKAPDADVAAKLDAIDWERDCTLLYVGRLISTKGVQSIIGALPLLFEREPSARLLVVGHGPLREPLEALLWALEHGHRDLVQLIARRGRCLEGSPEGGADGTELTQLVRFLDAAGNAGREQWFNAAQRHIRADRVIFTGYLTHDALRLLMPCCDVSIFPSVVREAGPLVFLEALACGSFPLGTDFGGMRASIDSLADVLPADVLDVMRLSPDPAHTVRDIVTSVPRALVLRDGVRDTLARIARERYDWASVARKLHRELTAS